MLRLLPLLLFLFAGCQRPVAAVLTYAPDPVAAEDDGTVDMNQVLSVVQKRLRSTGLPCRASLDNFQEIRIEVFTGEQATLDRIDRIVSAPGTLELRIAANEDDHAELIKQAEETDESEICDAHGRLLGWWVPTGQESCDAIRAFPDLITREFDRNGASGVELLVVNDPYQVDGSLLVRASPDVDQNGRPCVSFQLSDKGGQMMAGLTTENLPDPVANRTRKLAIIFNGRVFSTPSIQTTITNRGQITGDFAIEEVEELATILNSRAMPVPLVRVNTEHPVAEQ
jgi:preprotein translocase subunit SecD